MAALELQLSNASKKDRARIEQFMHNVRTDLADVRSKCDALQIVASGDLRALRAALDKAIQVRQVVYVDCVEIDMLTFLFFLFFQGTNTMRRQDE